ncbi:MAG TPA: hypothetical protein VKS21_05865, partial [Spirochaetota bacterium]|nr:hypothetical protein [Spirochaetota bacterium]
NYPTANLTDGMHDFGFILVSADGKTATNKYTYIIDNSPPAISVFNTADTAYLPAGLLNSSVVVTDLVGTLSNVYRITDINTNLLLTFTAPTNTNWTTNLTVASLGLGTYQLSMLSIDKLGFSNISSFSLFTVETSYENFGKIYAGPNPFYRSKDGSILRIGNLPLSAQLRMFDVSGQLVLSCPDPDIVNGIFDWPLFQGRKIPGGCYLLEVSDSESSDRQVIKLIIINDL